MFDNLVIKGMLDKGGERYLPLVQYILKKSNSELAFSDDINERIKRLRLAILVRNAFLFKELKKVLQALGEAGIEVIILKGAVMEEIYPAGLRPFADIDLLVHLEDMPRVGEALGKLGYQPEVPYSPWVWNSVLAIRMSYVKNGKIPIIVELHWELGPAGTYLDRVDISGIWERARKSKVADVDTLIPSLEDLILHICLHSFLNYNDWTYNQGLCDIAELVQRYNEDIDWEVFVRRVVEFKACLPVRYVLKGSLEVFKTPVPSFVFERLNIYKPSLFEKWAFRLSNTTDENFSSSKDVLAQFLRVQGVKGKIRFIRDVLYPQREFMLWRYRVKRPKLLPFYYLLRPVEGLKQFWAVLFR